MSEPTGFVYADDENKQIVDTAAIRKHEELLAAAEVAPKDRKPEDHSVGTPAHLEANTPDDTHSDGGNTPFVVSNDDAAETEEPAPAAE